MQISFTEQNIAIADNFSKQNNIKLDSCKPGDALDLEFEDNLFDLVLLLGPLYHLPRKEDRLKCIAEARRVIKPGGTLICAIISRYASLFDGFRRNLIADDEFFNIVMQDLQTGVHENPTANEEYFTTAYFQTPQEAQEEVIMSGFSFKQMIAVESVAWQIENYAEKAEEESWRSKVNSLIQTIESHPDIIAMSPHILIIAQKT